ncbi:MAG: hypothetical protein HYY04_07540 [Chloroflexi bacterium]|nr:hypothetical protein [Chloroflexota bacterium]
MIVRISTEGQYRLAAATIDRLNEIDNQIVAATAQLDAEAFLRLLDQMLTTVRTEGTPVGPEELVESDLILPPPDTTLDEARDLFKEEGLIPG